MKTPFNNDGRCVICDFKLQRKHRIAAGYRTCGAPCDIAYEELKKLEQLSSDLHWLVSADSRPARRAIMMMRVAQLMATMSSCGRGNHGCVLVSSSMRILSTGYNGSAARLSNGCVRDESGNCGCVHAEANACVQPRIDKPHFAFVTAAPCEQCAQLLINSQVRVVIYNTVTNRGNDGIRALQLAGVGCFHIDEAPSGIFLPLT